MIKKRSLKATLMIQCVTGNCELSPNVLFCFFLLYKEKD